MTLLSIFDRSPFAVGRRGGTFPPAIALIPPLLTTEQRQLMPPPQRFVTPKQPTATASAAYASANARPDKKCGPHICSIIAEGEPLSIHSGKNGRKCRRILEDSGVFLFPHGFSFCFFQISPVSLRILLDAFVFIAPVLGFSAFADHCVKPLFPLPCRDSAKVLCRCALRAEHPLPPPLQIRTRRPPLPDRPPPCLPRHIGTPCQPFQNWPGCPQSASRRWPSPP